jgi:hypothetical protein
MRQIGVLILSVILLAVTTPAHGGGGAFGPVPAVDGKKNTLQIRQLDFTGGATGQVVVEVRNQSQQPQTFEARGLYFVPNGNAQSAPQRVGAAGPFEVQEGQGWQRKDQLQVQPGQTVKLKLQTFCLDSHRGSPGKGQGYKVARDRLPQDLTGEIEGGARRIIRAKGGYSKAAEATGDIQSHVWSSRNKKWLKLEGERANEKSDGSSGPSQRHIRRQPVPPPRQGVEE